MGWFIIIRRFLFRVFCHWKSTHFFIKIISEHYERGWKVAQSFRDLNANLFDVKTISERQCREWVAGFKADYTGLSDNPGRGRRSGSRGRGRKNDNSNVERKCQFRPEKRSSGVWKSLVKCGNWRDGSPTNSLTTAKHNVSVSEESRHWVLVIACFQRLQKKKRFAFGRVKRRKMTTVRRQCLVGQK